MEKYIHKINYYETDKMGITHHSNYIRLMEEARLNFLEQIGFPYDKLERNGIILPVIAVECEYKNATTFGESIEIDVKIEEFKGIKLVIKYTMKSINTKKIVLVGKTKHCFIGKDNKPIILKREFPELDQKLKELVER